MPTPRKRSALVFLLLVGLLALSAGCDNLPGFLKRSPSASPTPAASETPGEGDSPQDIEGRVGNTTAATSL